MKKKLVFLMLGNALLLGFLGGCSASLEEQKNTAFDIKNIFEKENLAPIVVVGSGPAGLMASVYGARGGKETFVIEGNEPGGLLMKTTEVANWPGETMIEGPQIIAKLRAQAEHQNVTFVQDHVAHIDTDRWPYTIHLESGKKINALTIIIATGAEPRMLNVPGEQEYWGGGVTACAVCDAPFFKDEEVVVVGGGDSAVEEAIQLSPFAKKITIFVRKGEMRAAHSMQERLKGYPKIEVKYNVEIQKILGDLENVTGVELYNNKDKKVELFQTTGVFLAVGHIPNSSFVQGTLKTDPEGYIVVDRRKTSVAGIFAAGDIADKVYRQAGTSAGSGIEAALDSVQFLDDNGYTNQVAQQIKTQLFSENDIALQSNDLHELSSMEELTALVTNNPDQLVVIDFWTETCSSCKQMISLLKESIDEFDGSIIFASVDADEAVDIASTYNVMKVPALITLKKGVVQDKFTGFLGKKELRGYLEKQLAEGHLEA